MTMSCHTAASLFITRYTYNGDRWWGTCKSKEVRGIFLKEKKELSGGADPCCVTSGCGAGFPSGTFCVANRVASGSCCGSGGDCGGVASATDGASGSSCGPGCATGALGCESGGREGCATGECEGCDCCAASGCETAYGGSSTCV